MTPLGRLERLARAIENASSNAERRRLEIHLNEEKAKREKECEDGLNRDMANRRMDKRESDET